MTASDWRLAPDAGPRVLLLDADGNLFPSEAPAFVASADVTNRFLSSLGVQTRYTPEHLLAATTGKNFRATALDLAVCHGVTVESPLCSVGGSSAGGSTARREVGCPTLTAAILDEWVAEEKKVVSAYLGQVLRPDPAVLEPLRRVAGRYLLAAVSSSALSRLEECFRAAGISELIPADRRYSAEDSLPRPTSKPDPAVYVYAVEDLGVTAKQAVAVEDSLPGAQSAVAAGIATVGNLMFVPPGERDSRRAALLDAGVTAVIESWGQLAAALLDGASCESSDIRRKA
jgi:beta-phosphoglucomutase-like phosphatase (HAD superfamily)